MKYNIKYNVDKVAKRLNITRKKFKILSDNNQFDFVTVVKNKYRTEYYFDPLKTEEYIQKYLNILDN